MVIWLSGHFKNHEKEFVCSGSQTITRELVTSAYFSALRPTLITSYSGEYLCGWPSDTAYMCTSVCVRMSEWSLWLPSRVYWIYSFKANSYFARAGARRPLPRPHIDDDELMTMKNSKAKLIQQSECEYSINASILYNVIMSSHWHCILVLWHYLAF